MTQDIPMTTPIKLTSFEVYPYDPAKLVNWHEAEAYAQSLGDGWRLPKDEEETLLIYKHREELGLITDPSSDATWVWSSETNPACANFARIRSMAYGNDGWGGKGYGGLSVVCVRSER